ncbi:hypothetical protein [Nocardioides sp.]|uniref:hypothetical protein n=1 Tax=Nocardioides sp. TaxID=35761 RepID=UPI0026321242|nr:hypothetical protein [Nocardioides sp.]
MTRPDSPDYAEPAVLGPSRSPRPGARPDVRLWGGRGRRALRWACAAGALLLPAVLVVVLLSDRPGAESPEAAVEQLLGGIADLDGAAIVGVVAPDEVADAGRADDAYTRLESRVLREGEVPPVEVDRVLAAAEAQLGGSASRASLAVLAAVDLELGGLDLAVEEIDDGAVRVYLLDGTLAVSVDADRLPGDAVIDGRGPDGTRASYDMALAEGWQRDGDEFQAYLVTVEVDGRWFVSLEASADDLLGPP